jgi:hypothetical protein
MQATTSTGAACCAATATAKTNLGQHGLAEWIALALTAIALLAGWGLKSYVESRTVSTTAGGVSLSYPANWVRGGEGEDIITVFDPNSPSTVDTTFSVSAKPLPEGKGMDFLVSAHTLRRSQELAQFVALSTEPTTLAGEKAVAIHYGYAKTPQAGLAATAAMPVVVEALDTLVIRGDQFYVFTFAADAALYAQAGGTRRLLLDSVRFHL